MSQIRYVLENYQIQKSIGVGATSEVFQALNLSSDTVVALKRFHPMLMQSSDAELIQRIRAEVEVLKKLRHPNVVGLRAEHFGNGQYWLEIDFVDGQDLRLWMESNREQSLLEPRLFALVQIARGLGHAHEQAIIHRDLKPENILVSAQGEVRITDFGLARSLERITVTRLGLLVGSLGYMAPEVIDGKKATIQSDLFSFGVIAYEVLVGKAPFLGDSPQTLIRAVCDGKYRRLQEMSGRVPPAVARLIEQCLEVSPDRRPASIWSIEAELMNHLFTTGILSLCSELIVAKDESLHEAYRRKHARLTERSSEILGLAALNDTNKRELIYFATELKQLFPNDPMIDQILQRLAAPSPAGRRGLRAWHVATIMCVVGLATAVAIDFSKAPPAQPLGTIRFAIDQAVKVKVDGRVVEAHEREQFSALPGIHEIEMSKDGYAPIISKVEVSAGQTTLIQAEEP